jgi:hypothetical protein
MLLPRTEHVAERPSWDCRVCGSAWPCPVAKNDLAEQFHRFPAGMSMFMASCLYEAIEDLAGSGESVPADLFERFLSWVRRKP